MQRLTMRNATTNTAYLIDVDDDDVQDAIQKLAEYEDLEEQGLLVKLPFKVGDTVFVVGTKCLADQEPNEEWCAKHDCDECIYDKEYIVFEIKVYSHLLYVIMAEEDQNWIFGKTVFLTKSEAEKALEEMECEK